MWVPKSSNQLFIDFRRAILPVSLGTILVIHLLLAPPFWVMLLLCLVLPVLMILDRGLQSIKVHQFHQEFLPLLQHDEVESLERLVRRSFYLRLAGPRGFLEEKKSLIALLKRDWEAAERLLERAYILSPKEHKQALLPSLIRVKYECGNWAETEQIARQVVGKNPFAGTAELFLGLILCRREGERDEGIELLTQAAEQMSGEDRERALAALTELGRVRERFDESQEECPEALI